MARRVSAAAVAVVWRGARRRLRVAGAAVFAGTAPHDGAAAAGVDGGHVRVLRRCAAGCNGGVPSTTHIPTIMSPLILNPNQHATVNAVRHAVRCHSDLP